MTRILDPTLRVATPAVDATARAERPARLDGATLGLLANGKTHGMTFLDRIAEHLRARHGVGDLLRLTKPNASAPAPPEDAKRMALKCRAIVTAIGD
jgi:hypothetical protein